MIWLASGLSLLLLIAWALSAPPWRGPPTAHFDGRRFKNRLPDVRSLRGAIREGLAWPPRRASADPPQPPPPPRSMGLRVTWVGHATALVQVAGRNILTDPVWSRAAGPGGWVGPRRLRAPGLDFAALPPIDLVLISHNHYDHLDLPSLRRLWARDKPRIVVPLGVGAQLRRAGIEVAAELDWEGRATPLPGVDVVATECRHFSGRSIFDRDRTLWCAWVFVVDGVRCYFGGDTGFGPHFEETGARHGPFALALVPIGAYHPRGFFGPVHINPEEAVAAHLALRAERSLGVHWGSFPLTFEPIDEPPERLRAALARAGVPEAQFRTLTHGGSWVLQDERTV